MTDVAMPTLTQVAKRARVEALEDWMPIFWFHPSFLAEPWCWLLAMIVRKPARALFISDELEAPGPWLVAFQNGREMEFGATASRAQIVELVRIFKDTHRSYAAWRALGCTDAEGRRMIRDLEEPFARTRRLLCALIRPRVLAATDERTATLFVTNSSAADIPLPTFFKASLSNALRVKVPTVNESDSKTTSGSAPRAGSKSCPIAVVDLVEDHLPPPDRVKEREAGNEAGNHNVAPSARQVKKAQRAQRWKDKMASAKKNKTRPNEASSPTRLQKAEARQRGR
jgi:hypothetical protein